MHQLDSDENYISESSLTLSVTEQLSLRLSASGFYLGSVGFETRLGKGKVKVDSAHGMKVYGGDGGIAPLPGRLTPEDVFSGDCRIGRWVRPRFDLDGLEKRKTSFPSQGPKKGLSACGIFTILTELSGLGHRLT